MRADTCDRLQIPPRDRAVVDARSWKLDGTEKMELNRLLSGTRRPTAIVAGGYYLTLDVYGAAATTALSIPADLSVVGVDDPPSAGHLSPPLTTVPPQWLTLAQGCNALDSGVVLANLNDGSPFGSCTNHHK